MLQGVKNLFCCGSEKAAPLCTLSSQEKFYLITLVVGGIICALGVIALASYLNPTGLSGTYQLTLSFATKVGTDVLTVAIFGVSVGGGITFVSCGSLLIKIYRHHLCGCKVESVKSLSTSSRTEESISQE